MCNKTRDKISEILFLDNEKENNEDIYAQEENMMHKLRIEDMYKFVGQGRMHDIN